VGDSNLVGIGRGQKFPAAGGEGAVTRKGGLVLQGPVRSRTNVVVIVELKHGGRGAQKAHVNRIRIPGGGGKSQT